MEASMTDARPPVQLLVNGWRHDHRNALLSNGEWCHLVITRDN